MSKRTVIRGGWIVAYSGDNHVLVRNGVVVVDGAHVTAVEPNYSGRADLEIDARDQLVLPGFIDLHVHNGTRAKHRLIADTGRKEYYGQPFWHWIIARPGARAPDDSRYQEALGPERNPDDPDDLTACFTVAELLRNGITTFFEVGSQVPLQERLAAATEQLGIRAYLGAGFQSSSFQGTEDGRFARYDYEDLGEGEMRVAVEFVERYDGAADDRVRGALVPREVEVCTFDLLEKTASLMEAMDVRVQIHAAYNPREWQYVIEDHGCTPIELLDRAGLLGPRVMIGHGNLTAESPLTNWAGGRDLETLGATGTTVVHSPINIMRRGRSLDNWTAYRRAGVNMAMGTDTYPRDMLMQMRMASYMCKILTHDFSAAPAQEVFSAATLGGAYALGRDDLGRIARGARADIVIMDLRSRDSMRYGVVRDPIKAIVDCGVADDVDTVLVDGKVRMRNRVIPNFDMETVLDDAQERAERWWATVQEWDPLGETAEQRCPWSYPLVDPTDLS